VLLLNENSRNHRRKGNCNLCLVTMLLVEIEITMFELHLINTNKFGTDFFFFFCSGRSYANIWENGYRSTRYRGLSRLDSMDPFCFNASPLLHLFWGSYFLVLPISAIGAIFAATDSVCTLQVWYISKL
jgi:hypothetical protein